MQGFKETVGEVREILRLLKGGIQSEAWFFYNQRLKNPLVRAWVHGLVLPYRRLKLWMAAKLAKRREAGAPTKPAPGWVWNPLLRYPRNRACYCGSGVKFKKCHYSREVRVVQVEKANFLEGYLQAAGVA